MAEKTLAEIKAELEATKDLSKHAEIFNKLAEKRLELLIKTGELTEAQRIAGRVVLMQRQEELGYLGTEKERLEEIKNLTDSKYASQVASQLLRENDVAYRAAEIRDLEKQLVLSKGRATADREGLAKRLRDLKEQQGAQRLLDKATPDIFKKMVAAPKATMYGFVLATAGSLITKMIALAKSLHDTEAAFMKATGASKDFAGSITNVFEETRKYGATAQDVTEAITALRAGFTDFTFASKQQRESLTDTGVVLGRMGISHQDFAKGIQISTKALGMSGEAAGKEMLNMQKFAENLGVSHVDLANQFAGAGNMMAKMGDRGVEAFKDLAIASKFSGMEMQKILTLTDKFDTFEGAATMAGKLNAAMGGNFVNAMEMMMATEPAERFGMIRDSLANAGLEFDNMSYYQKKFFAESMGLSDVSELALIMSGNIGLVEESVNKSSQSYEDAAKRAQTMASFQEKLNMVFMQLIPVMTEVMEGVSEFILWVANSPEAIGALKGIVKVLGLAFGVLAVKLLFAAGAFLVATAPIWLIPAAIAAAIAALGALGGWLFTKKMSPFTFLGGLGEIQKTFEGIGGAMDALPTEKGLELTTSMKDAPATMALMKGPGIPPTEKGPELTTSMKGHPTTTALMKGAATSNIVAKVAPPASARREAPDRAREKIMPEPRITEKILQPVSIELKGDKLANFVVEVIGQNVSTRIKPYA